MSKREANCLRDLLIIRQHNRNKIDAVNQNLGSALGYKYKGGEQTNPKHPAIIVFVPDKIDERFISKSQRVAKEFSAPDPKNKRNRIWCKVDVVRGGKAALEERLAPLSNENVEIAEDLRKGRIGLIGGVQLGSYDEHGKEYAGTAACAVKDRSGKIYLLTNQHISGPVGSPIYHPRPGRQLIGRTKKALGYVDDEIHYGKIVDEKNALIRVDCALVSVNENALQSVKPGVHILGEPGEVMPVNLNTMDIIGTEVVSIGSARGFQKGIIAAYAYEWLDDEKLSVYTDFLIIGDNLSGAFSGHGDSGKIILTADGLRPVALLWGGWQEKLRKGFEQENWTYAIDISKVLKYLHVNILSNSKKLKKLNPDVLLKELKGREKKLKKSKNPLLKNIDTMTLVNTLKGIEKARYGVDDRKDLFELKSPSDNAILKSADCVCGIFHKDRIPDNGNGTSTLQTENYGDRYKLCLNEPFRDQPSVRYCGSGFVVGKYIIATAGHCVLNDEHLQKFRFVFGFRMLNSTTAQAVISNQEIYKGLRIIDRRYDSNAIGPDWALVEVDGPITHYIPKIRTQGKIPDSKSVYVIGHPRGLPLKFADGAEVRNNQPSSYFVTNLDTYFGNSGSPVFNKETHVVEGIQARGEEYDFLKINSHSHGECVVSRPFPSSGGLGAQSTRTTEFSHLL